MKKEEESMQLTVNVNDYQRNELDKICETHDVSTDTVLNRAVDYFILSGMGFDDVEQEKAFNDFKSYIVKIIGFYKASMVRENIKERMVRQSTRKQLNSAFSLSQENREIRDELSKLTELKSILEERVAVQADVITLLREKIDSYERKNKMSSELQAENFELKQRMEEMEDKHIKQIKKLQDDNFQKILKVMQDKRN